MHNHLVQIGMSTIQGIARFHIHPEKLDEFKRLSAECIRLSREKDIGTLRYELFFNEEQTECIVHEEYVDSNALIQHFNNMADNAAALFAITDVEGELWGEPNDELRKNAKAYGLKIYSPFLSIDRQ